MEQPVMSDKNQYPADEVIFFHIGKAKVLWQDFFKYLDNSHPDFVREWRYYNDGKSWLMKVTQKTKTIFWLSIIKDAFRITFYFTDRAEPVIMDSNISYELKEQFKSGKHFGKIRGLTITFKSAEDIEYVKTLISVKLSIK
ncbi:MAG: DUF3788 family protein [Calditrichaceae bacterium]|nr:DUF3788 family protein [Calditrichaceae bacterium]MBN2709519.1 DUF3788 family protein [Calditrichaceae bacterium]RQV93127.1 MAG: DUF3788 family protein [Calditrichota bacterium]